MTYNIMLEKLLVDIGGCGKFQWIAAVVISFSTIIDIWSMLHMSFMGQEPNFFCSRNNSLNNTRYDINGKSCAAANSSACSHYQFEDEIQTIVSQWNLVCEKKWIVATITSLQMAGVLIGTFVAGHVGDWFGRKPSFYCSIASLIILNVIGYFSVSWEMYATVRFLIGIGLGFSVVCQLNILCEFLTSPWRPLYLGFPTWSTVASSFGLLAWVLKDWKNIHLATAIVGVPFLFSWWLVQESFRWLITNGQYDRAKLVVNKIASINQRPMPDLSEIVKQAKLEDSISSQHRYSVLDLFKTKANIIKSTAIVFIWASMSYAYYGLTFGIQNMAGDLYLNMFLSSIIEIPANFITVCILSRYGRKRWCIIVYFFTGLCGLANGTLQNVESPAHDVLVNVFALGARLGIAAAWAAQSVMIVEMYPTVIRGTAVGLANTSVRIGSMIAPQMVFLNNYIPGILFFLSAAVTIISSLLCFLFDETKGQDLQDTMISSKARGDTCLVENGEKIRDDTPDIGSDLINSLDNTKDKEIVMRSF